MADTLAVFEQLPQHTQTIVWGERQVRFRLTWRERTGSWYIDIFELDDVTLIVAGRRVSALWVPLTGLALGDSLARDRELYVIAGIGADPFPRADLNQDGPVQLILILDDELPPVVEDPNLAVTVVLVTP